LAHANPLLRDLITSTIGPEWVADLGHIKKLEESLNRGNAEFMHSWHDIKQQNKQNLADMVYAETGVEFKTNAIFDVQVKRVHEYKRQLLNILHVIHLYNRIKQGDTDNWTPRCVLVGGKAAPGYHMAKLIIKLVNNVAEIVNGDSEVGDKLKVAFLPNYNVSRMEIICPGTDLSEQISTAGKEASGTGNMKFMMNGAITIGTYDGANIEILEAVGADNFFLFGLNAGEVDAMRAHYQPQQVIDNDPDLAAVMHLLESGHFNLFEPHIFDDVINSLKNPHDPWLTLADFRSYIDCQQSVADFFRDRDAWTRMSILNTSRSGFFSTDRTMQQYNAEIWKL
ncbi:MAG: glycogen/starch/alpha-glucan phosphorylase, partial [Gammaproteobacteria bacterium]